MSCELKVSKILRPLSSLAKSTSTSSGPKKPSNSTEARDPLLQRSGKLPFSQHQENLSTHATAHERPQWSPTAGTQLRLRRSWRHWRWLALHFPSKLEHIKVSNVAHASRHMRVAATYRKRITLACTQCQRLAKTRVKSWFPRVVAAENGRLRVHFGAQVGHDNEV